MEYLTLSIDNIKTEMDKLGAKEYWKNIKSRRTSPNGVFGFKIFPVIYRDALNKFPELLPYISADYVLHLRRRNIIMQAISYYRAINSGAWFFDDDRVNEACYDFDKIRAARNCLTAQERDWRQIFELTGCDPFLIYYEDFLESPAATIENIIDHMSVKLNPISSVSKIPTIMRQSDRTALEWEHLYFTDCLTKGLDP